MVAKIKVQAKSLLFCEEKFGDLMSIFEVSLLACFILYPILSALLIVFYFWYKDKYEREPIRLVLKMFIWGSTIAIVVAVFLEVLIICILTSLIPPEVLGVIFPIVIAPLVEEYAKGRGIVRLRKNPEYEGMMDGIVYGVAIGAGFGLTENILYGLNALILGGMLSAVLIIVIRSSLEIIGHPFYTSWIGGEVGLQKMYGKGGYWNGYIAAVTLHGIWNSIMIIAIYNEVLALLIWFLVICVYVYLLRRRLKIALRLEKEIYE